jgi:hypothetical protein
MIRASEPGMRLKIMLMEAVPADSTAYYISGHVVFVGGVPECSIQFGFSWERPGEVVVFLRSNEKPEVAK